MPGHAKTTSRVMTPWNIMPSRSAKYVNSGSIEFRPARASCSISESPFAHWADSPAAEDGVGCADCHMASDAVGPRADFDGLAPVPLADHRFPGLNGSPEDAVALLARAARIELARTGGNAVLGP